MQTFKKLLIIFQKEEAMFADLWHNDMLAKKQREDEDARKHLEKNYQTAAVLKEQMKVLEHQKEEEKRLRLENTKLIVRMMFQEFFRNYRIFNNFNSLFIARTS